MKLEFFMKLVLSVASSIEQGCRLTQTRKKEEDDDGLGFTSVKGDTSPRTSDAANETATFYGD
eukprot:5912473-Pleurochrysis_carterae.AAC.1